jgi:hypothetical protein
MYQCVRQTLTHDLSFHEIQALSPAGTQSLKLYAGAPPEPDGVTSCEGETAGDQLLIASIQGTHRQTALDGYGVTVPAGYQLQLVLHLVNTSAQALSGSSVVEVR